MVAFFFLLDADIDTEGLSLKCLEKPFCTRDQFTSNEHEVLKEKNITTSLDSKANVVLVNISGIAIVLY